MNTIPTDGVMLRDITVSGQNTYTVRNPDGTWPSPPGENQASYTTYSVVDSMACVSYSAVHAIESQVSNLFGDTTNYSERFLAKMSGTTPQGNYIDTVYNTLMQFGLATDVDWPEPQTFTWDTYYADIPQSVQDKAKAFLEKYTVTWRPIPEADVPQALQEAPVTCIITKENPSHAVELISATTYFDTYQPYVKPLGTVHSYYQIVINRKEPMNQALVVKSEKPGSQDVYVCYKMPSMDYLRTKASIEGIVFDENNIPAASTL